MEIYTTNIFLTHVPHSIQSNPFVEVKCPCKAEGFHAFPPPTNTAGESHGFAPFPSHLCWSYLPPIPQSFQHIFHGFKGPPKRRRKRKRHPEAKLGRIPGKTTLQGTDIYISPLLKAPFGWMNFPNFPFWLGYVSCLEVKKKQLRGVVTWFMMAWWLEVLEGEWYDFCGCFTLLCLWQMRSLARKVQNMLSPRFAIFVLFLAQIKLVGIFMYFI